MKQADATDITKESSTEFLFKVNGVKHTFQAGNTSERDSWVAALETKSADAKSQKETLTGSEGYKKELEKLSKSAWYQIQQDQANFPDNPAAAAAAAAAEKKPAENKDETKKEEPKKEDAVAAPAEENKETKDKSAKSRSQSRKRTSLFGTLLGKKEETEENKPEEKPEEAKPAEASKETPAEPAQPTEAPAESKLPTAHYSNHGLTKYSCSCRRS